ncbi:MAG TPA: ketopantoate reductase C-terminal domain-containing protein [Gammaproteobacteria bacterium]|nr:ketopantoate reductase C-terminal domain-containing protein [Gammaproteobacteria bacterium]
MIIALKTTANHHLASLLAQCVHDQTLVLVMQNGIGCEEWVAQYTGKAPIICAITFVGAYREGIDVMISILGQIKLAPYGSATPEMCQRIIDAFHHSPIALQCSIHDNYKLLRWTKLMWNIPFGALTIIFDIPTHRLASEEPYQSMVYSLLDEISLIAKAEGIAIEPAFHQQLVEFTAKSGHYFPTLYRDYQAGKPIEKEYMFDNVLAIAKQHQCVVPTLTLIEKQLQTLLQTRN